MNQQQIKVGVITLVLALLSGCASGHNYGGALLLGIFLPDPNSLTAEDREIMAREQAEADAAEQRAKEVPINQQRN